MSVSTKVEAPNPLEEGLRRRRTPEPCALTIFGASGDLTQRKLFPALYALAVRNLLPPKFGVVGVARTEMTGFTNIVASCADVRNTSNRGGSPVWGINAKFKLPSNTPRASPPDKPRKRAEMVRSVSGST